MKKYLLAFIFLPSLTFASFGEEMNALLKNFFSVEETTQQLSDDRSNIVGDEYTINDQSANIHDIPLEPLEVKTIEVEDHFSLKGLKSLKKQVFLEEEDLAFTELEIEGTLSDLEQMLQEKQQLEGELSSLDIHLGKVSRRLETLKKRSQELKQELITLTQQRSDLRVLLRVREREYQAFLKKNYLQNESMTPDGEISMLKWLFAEATVSQLLEERRNQKIFEVQKKTRLKSLQNLKNEIQNNEKYMAEVYGKVESVRNQVAQEKKWISDEVYTKAGTVSQIDSRNENMQQELRNLRRRQAESTLYLQNLRQAVGEVKENLENEKVLEEESIFDFPLQLEPVTVTAHFHDEDYKQEMGVEHNGLDFYAPFGTNVYAPAKGIVKKVGNNGYGYSYVVVEHEDEFLTLYGHLSDIFVNEGMAVDRGDIIARTGGAGGDHGTGAFSTGKHLHFEMMRKERFVDPIRFLPIIGR